jgi:uncharacterized protein YihD (DUF1040 family)
MDDTVEVSAAHLQQLQQAYALQEKLFNNKESKKFWEKSIKSHPEFKDRYQTVEDIAEPVLSPMRDELKELKEKLKAREEKESDDHYNQIFKKLSKERGYTDEGIEQIKRVMVDKNIADAEAAADHWERKNPAKPAESSGYGTQSWNFTDGADKDGDAKGWFNNAEAMIDRIATEEFSKTGSK